MMLQNNPKVEIPIRPKDRLLLGLGILILLANTLWIAIEYAHLPEQVPIHFNAKGQADDYAGKASIWGVLGINVVLFVLMSCVAFFIKPWNFNIPIKVTPDNAEKAYTLTREMLLAINVIIVFIFVFVSFEIITVSKGASGLGIGLLPIIIGSIIFTTVYYLIKISSVKPK